MTREEAERIVDAIISDLSDRRGIGDELEMCTEDVRDEMRETWIGIVMGENV